MSILGLIAVGVAALITQIPTYHTPPSPFNFPVFYELIGFILLILAPISLFILGTKKKNLFKEKTAERFYKVLLVELARSKDETIDSIVNIIGANLNQITLALKTFSPRSQGQVESNNGLYGVYANGIFDVILGDPKVANYIVTGRLEFIHALFFKIKSNGITRRHSNIGVAKIFERLFENPNSYLYNQLDHSGLSLSVNIYELLFGNLGIVNNFNVFGAWHNWATYPTQRDDRYLKVYVTALKTSIDKYFNSSQSFSEAKGIVEGLRKLNGYMEFSGPVRDYENEIRNEILHELSFFLGHEFIYIYRKAIEDGRINDIELEARQIDAYTKSVAAAYAETLYKFLTMLSTISSKDDSLRMYAMSACREIVSISATPGDKFEGIRKMFIKLIWEGLENNSKGFYPAVMPIYILLVGFHVGSNTSVGAIERNKLIDFLEKEIRPKIIAGVKMANKEPMKKVLLSSNVEFNRATGKFEYIDGGGNRTEMDKV